MEKTKLILALLVLPLLVGCLSTDCPCPSRDMVLRGINTEGKATWFYIKKGDLNPGVNEDLKMTPEEAYQEQLRLRAEEESKYGI